MPAGSLGCQAAACMMTQSCCCTGRLSALHLCTSSVVSRRQPQLDGLLATGALPTPDVAAGSQSVLHARQASRRLTSMAAEACKSV